MSASYTPTRVGGTCTECHLGEWYQYPQDAKGVLRCGRCGELKSTPKPKRGTKNE